MTCVQQTLLGGKEAEGKSTVNSHGHLGATPSHREGQRDHRAQWDPRAGRAVRPRSQALRGGLSGHGATAELGLRGASVGRRLCFYMVSL